jgi:two-component system LytT family response regulator
MEHIPIYVYSTPIAVSQIVRIEASSCYCRVYFAQNPPVMVAKVLQWFEHYLVPAGFIRIHRSHLINSSYVHCFLDGMQHQVQLKNGDSIPVSRRRHKEAKYLLS